MLHARGVRVMPSWPSGGLFPAKRPLPLPGADPWHGICVFLLETESSVCPCGMNPAVKGVFAQQDRGYSHGTYQAV